MKIIPVIDVLEGVVVRGVAGERELYQPVQSCLTSSVEPLEMADAIRDSWETDWLYLADLDAITGLRANWELYTKLQERGFQVLLDAGIRERKQIDRVFDAGVGKTVLGLETLPGPEMLREAILQYGAEQLVFSLDMKQGKPLTKITDWKSSSAEEIAAQVIEWGYQELILLDLADVGTGNGLSTIPLCTKLKERNKEVSLITGGGVRTVKDWERCQNSEVIDGLLVASAIHNGSLSPEMLRG